MAEIKEPKSTSLADVQSKRKALAQKLKLRREAEQLSDEQRELDLDEQELLIRDAQPNARIVRTPAGVVALTPPKSADFQLFVDSGANTKHHETALFVRSCVAAPSVTDFDSMVDRQPAIIKRLSDEVCYLAGVEREAVDAKS